MPGTGTSVRILLSDLSGLNGICRLPATTVIRPDIAGSPIVLIAWSSVAWVTSGWWVVTGRSTGVVDAGLGPLLVRLGIFCTEASASTAWYGVPGTATGLPLTNFTMPSEAAAGARARVCNWLPQLLLVDGDDRDRPGAYHRGATRSTDTGL